MLRVVRFTSFAILSAGLLAGVLSAARGAADPAPDTNATEIVLLASAAQNGELVPCG